MNQEKKEMLTQFHRQNIIKAAEMLFFEKGVVKTTMDDVAKEAGYSKATLYVYFKSKDEIYDTITCQSMLILKERLEKVILSDKGAAKRYYAVCYTLVDFQEKYPLYFESILGEIRVDADAIQSKSILRDIFLAGEEINEIIMKFISEGIQEGILQEDLKLPQTVFILWSSISGIIRMADQKKHYFETILQIPKKEFLQYSFDILLNSILKNKNINGF